MKPRIDFYIIAVDQYSACLKRAYQLVNKAFQQGHSLEIRCDSAENCKQFDHDLWCNDATSFIPHQTCKTNDTIIQINNNADKSSHLLLNLRINEKIENGNWHRILQFVPQQPELLTLARQHYRQYQSQGHTVNTHKVAN